MADLITNLDAEGLIQILAQDEDFNEDDVEIIKAEGEGDEDVLLLSLDEEMKICFNFLDDRELIVMTLSLGNLEEMGADWTLVNDFNTDSVNSAAFVDEDGDLILRSTLCLRGGVSQDSVNELINNFSEDLDLLSEMIAGDDCDCDDCDCDDCDCDDCKDEDK